MDNLPASKPTQLLRPWMIGLVALIVGMLLVLSYTREDVLLPGDGEAVDGVALNYAELLLKAHPEDQRLRLRILDELIGLGEFQRARAYLQDLPQLEPFYDVLIDILSSPATLDETARQRLVERLERLERGHLDNARMQRLADAALRINAPRVALAIYQELAARDPADGARWLAEAARWSLAAGDPAHAAELYRQLAKDDPAYLRPAFDSLLAAGQGAQAAELLAEHLDHLGDDDDSLDWLASAVAAAQGSLRYDLAQQLLQRWHALRDDDPRALRADFRISLAVGDIDRAWALGPRMLEQDPSLLAELARLAEWTGHPQQALGYWVRLLQSGQASSEVREHAWRLALQLFDFEHSVNVLAEIKGRRRMSDEEVDALVYSHETRGTPEQAEAWLRDYLQRYPQHHFAWQRLQRLLESSEQLQAEARHWAAMAERFPLSLSERLHWAETLWNLFEQPQAWDVLDALHADQVDAPEYWKLRAELAWELELDNELQVAYERLQALGESLGRDDEDRLLMIYQQSDPRRALALLLDSWRRTGSSRRLVDALQLAEQLRDWTSLRQLLAESHEQRQLPQHWLARAALAAHEGHPEHSLELYRQALTQFPQNNQIRERMLWFYIEHGRRDELQPLLRQWRPLALKDSRLWLPFASAHLQLSQMPEALAWFRRHLQVNPGDQLARAAYADALDGAGYQDRAMRLRRHLLQDMQRQGVPGSAEAFTVYLRLLAASHGQIAAQAQARQAGEGMLQVWFEHFLGQFDVDNREPLKDDWLAWAHERGLEVSDYEKVQQALRQDRRAVLQRLLEQGTLDAAHQVAAEERLGWRGKALATALGNLGGEQPASVREQLLRQSAGLLERSPQGLQLAWRRQDFGDLELRGPSLQVARNLGRDWYADLRLEQGRYDSRRLDSGRIGDERNLHLLLRRDLADGDFSLILDGSWRDDQDRHGLGLERNWQLRDGDELGAFLDWRRESEETGLLRALGRRDGFGVRGQHGFSARDRLHWSLAHNRYASRAGEALGNGEALSLAWDHTLFFDDPAWLLRSGVDYQRNRVRQRLSDDLLASHGGVLLSESTEPLAAGELLQERYGQVYLGSTWRRGFPGALNRTRAQFTWMLDTMVGWQWIERSFNYGVDLGLGMELLGDDELAFTLGYQSAPRGGAGKAGSRLAITYSSRFGR